MNVIEYCIEEVQRQGHYTLALDGIERVGWMLDAWSYALKYQGELPTMAVIMELGMKVERQKNAGGFRTVGVQVGGSIKPEPVLVRPLLEDLVADLRFGTERESLDFYRRFEEIHPFVDGNGRVGKILLNWLNISLLSPIFPPSDFWGIELRNP